MVVSNTLHCKQSTYNLRQIGLLAKKINDPFTRVYLADKIVSRYTFSNPTPSQTKAVNHCLTVLKDNRRV